MNTSRTIACIARLTPLVMLAALAACEPTADQMGTQTGPLTQTPPPIVVRDQSRHLAVSLAGNGAITGYDWGRIDRFLGDAAPGRPETVRLTIAGNAPPPVVDLVIRHAFAFGYAENKIAVAPPRPVRGMRGAHLDLTSRTAVAVLPNCPQTSHLTIIDGDNRVGSDLGCAYISNLELQVADPHDLVRGQGGGEADSVLTTAAIHRLQTDKVKKLDTTSSTAGTTGGGASQ